MVSEVGCILVSTMSLNGVRHRLYTCGNYVPKWYQKEDVCCVNYVPKWCQT